MTHPFIEKFPELVNEPMKSMLAEYKRLASYDSDIQKYVIMFLLEKLSSAFMKFKMYGVTEQEKHDTADLWRSGLCDLTFPGIISGLYAIVTGKTDCIEWPPTNPIAFHKISKQQVSYHVQMDKDLSCYDKIAWDRDSAKKRSDSLRKVSREIIKEDILGSENKLANKVMNIFTKKEAEELNPEEQDLLERQRRQNERYKKEIETNGRIVS
jgi:hypothetical protein